jgi:hypothetical protein
VSRLEAVETKLPRLKPSRIASIVNDGGQAMIGNVRTREDNRAPLRSENAGSQDQQPNDDGSKQIISQAGEDGL